jgi:phage terminase large subunit GpA-like protein
MKAFLDHFAAEADALITTTEGDAIGLAEKRTLSFDNRRIVVGSTPLDEATSHIARLYAQSDQRIFEVPCPQSAQFSELAWSAIESPWPLAGDGAAGSRPVELTDIT